MKEFHKNISEINEDDSGVVDTSNNDRPINLEALSANIPKRPSALLSAKDQAATDFSNARRNYVKREKQINDMLVKPGYLTSHDIRNIPEEYENVLQENIAKLKGIAQQDLENAKENYQKHIDEAKDKLHQIITKAFSGKDANKEFVATIDSIFADVNKKILDDLQRYNYKLERNQKDFKPDYSNVFINPTSSKSPEEIEVEREIQKMFEDQLLKYSEQLKQDLLSTEQNITKQVEEMKVTVNDTTQYLLAKTKELPAVDMKQDSLPNIPTTSTMQQNINTLLKKVEDDFQKINDSMKVNVDENKKMVNEKVKYISESITGTRIFGSDDDDD